MQLLHTQPIVGSSPTITTKFCKCQQEKVTLSRFLRRTETVEGYGFDARWVHGGALTGQVFQVTYPDPAGFISRENGCDERGATTYKFNLFGNSVMVTLQTLTLSF